MRTMAAKETISKFGFTETVEQLGRAAEEAGLKVISRIDAQANLMKIGLQIDGNTILEIFHPKLAMEVFEKDIRAGIVPPLRIYIYEYMGKTHVVSQNASELFSDYNGLSDLGRRLDETLSKIINAVE
jgi:uncharacterized protein (DUF302 family)